MNRTIWVVAAAFLLALAAQAQQARSEVHPVSDVVRQLLARQSQNIIAAVEELPAEKFDFRPTPQQMTFAHLVTHMAESNTLLCSRIGNVSAPPQVKLVDTDKKPKLVEGLRQSFDFCSRALDKVDDSKLAETINVFGAKRVSRVAAMFALTNDWADHYSAAAMYLRLNGLLPPTAKNAGPQSRETPNKPK
ncbi:MAG TPA: DinB family protein [Clostridia bacterium]|nr:DinB family protein [Clostridia bacterium]